MVVGCQTGDATNKTMAEPSPASAQSSAILKDVSNADFASLMSSLENPVVLDVRTPEEWNEGHLEVYNLEHGLSSWEQEGFPVVTGPTKTF